MTSVPIFVDHYQSQRFHGGQMCYGWGAVGVRCDGDLPGIVRLDLDSYGHDWSYGFTMAVFQPAYGDYEPEDAHLLRRVWLDDIHSL